MQGRVVAGRYRLDEAIGSGGMGRVWRAHDEVLHRAVAIKELTAALYASDGDRSVLLARTRGEARAAARINHSAVVTVHDVFEHDGRPWIVMELVEGRSLADAVRDEERVVPTEAARVGLWVLRALRAAHTAGVLHRDVKPGNVLLADDGRVLLTDFGIAQIEGDSTITRTGEVVGSVDYLAPERVRGHDPGPASDLWALGATLYTAVEGRSPFRRTSPLSTMQAVVEEEAAEPLRAGPLAPVISALLAKDPAQRPDATEAEQMLAEAAEGRRPNAAQAYVATRYSGYRPDGTGGPTGHRAGHPAEHGHPAGHPGGPTGHPAAHPGGYAGGFPAVGSGGYPAGQPGGPPAGPVVLPGAGGPAGADPSATRPTALVPPPGPATSVRSRGRRLRTLALAVAVVVLLAGAAAVVWRERDGAGTRRADGTSPSAPADTTTPAGSPAPTTPAGSQGPADPSAPAATADGGTVPAGWVRHDDPLGFGLSLPAGWERRAFDDQGDLRQIDYSPDGGEHFLRIAVDTSPDFNDPYAHQLDLEQQLQRLVDYRRLDLERTTYRDRDSSRWEYAWTALAKDTPFPGPRRAIEEMYMSRDGVEYALYLSAPAEDWAEAREQFRTVLQSWQEGRPA
ncbi:serine/threonine-protein kinase [Streptomyces sp. SID8352]|uniref:serine/threonine-protein kinase n=1 Tax=Streptomyces sp. SID8352 TaxID=2690338 RepID=UPI00136FFCA5|nr:serine/threonine-protein kinase [Streptomyces sp. SID8352]